MVGSMYGFLKGCVLHVLQPFKVIVPSLSLSNPLDGGRRGCVEKN